MSDSTFNAEYVELAALGAHSVTECLTELARAHRQTGAIYANEGNVVVAVGTGEDDGQGLRRVHVAGRHLPET